MADKKVSELDAITGANTAADDLFLIVDSSGSVTKKITRAELNNAIEQDVLSTVDINGGTIDSTVIGGSTPAAGDFTTLGATGNITVGGTVDGRDVAADGTKLDGIEASATADQTDAEIRAAVEAASDSNVFTDADHTKLNGIEASADVTDATNVAAAGALMTSGGTVTGDINFGDNDKAIFGAASDLQITHTGSHSQIVDSGTGGLFIGGSSQIGLMNAALSEYMVNAVENGAVTLYHDNAAKIATTSTGVSVTGQVIATKGSTGTLATFTDGVATNFTLKTDGNSVGTFGTEAGSTQLAFMVANSEKMRLDGSGNVLVGKTALGTANDGLQVKPAGELVVTRNGNHSLILNRKSSDGNIALFQKDGTTVGAIGALGGRMFAGSGDVGVFFDSTNNMITPYSIDAGDTVDNTIDLGYSSRRFKNLYLSGGAYIGGTAAANQLDDYEEGTWTPTASGGYTVSSASGAYTKIGRVVHLWGTVQFSAVGGNTSTVVLGSAPFTNSTHLGTGVCRENTNTGAIYVFRVAPNSTSMEINTMTGVVSGTRTIRTGENYAFHGSYYVA